MNRQLVSVTDAVPYQEFAKLIGKTPRAVRGMIEKGKLPVIEITDPQSVSGRAGEYWVYLPAWNNGLKLAYTGFISSHPLFSVVYGRALSV
ncbi:TPA: Cox family DNA-binding protein [Escherichia coli]